MAAAARANFRLQMYLRSGCSLIEANLKGNQFCRTFLCSRLRTALSSNFVRSTRADFSKPRSRSVDNFALKSHFKRTTPSLETEEKEYSGSDSDDDEDEEVTNKNTASRSKRTPWTKTRQKTGDKTLKPSKYLFRDLRTRGDEEEEQWIIRQAPVDAKSKAGWYARQMLRLSRDDKMEKAQELLSTMKEAKIQPTVEHFNILISGYAKDGNVRKAFNLFNDMKKRSLKPTCHTYSSLFNACTKSPFPQHSLQRAEKLLIEIHGRIAQQDLEVHPITFNAAIQAFTICGNPSQAFEIYKEMQESNIETDVYTYSSLLGACCHDQVNGPRTVFRILQEMKASEIKPDIFIYNSVLKVMRDFKVFSQKQQRESTKDKINSLVREPETATEANKESISAEAAANDLDSSLQDKTEMLKDHQEGLNLQNYFPGVEKFIQLMAVEDVYPDVRTFQLLLYLTSSAAEEEYLMQVMNACGVAPDVTFYNTLVKRKALKGDLTKAKQHMQELKDVLKVCPTEKSFETLAFSCKDPEEGLKLLEEIKSEGIMPTQAVYGALIVGAAKRKKFSYLIQLMKSMTSNDVQPNERILETLERTRNLPKPFIPETAHRRVQRNQMYRYREQNGFRGFFDQWKKEVFGGTGGRKGVDSKLKTDHSGKTNVDTTFNHL